MTPTDRPTSNEEHDPAAASALAEYERAKAEALAAEQLDPGPLLRTAQRALVGAASRSDELVDYSAAHRSRLLAGIVDHAGRVYAGLSADYRAEKAAVITAHALELEHGILDELASYDLPEVYELAYAVARLVDSARLLTLRASCNATWGTGPKAEPVALARARSEIDAVARHLDRWAEQLVVD